MSENSIKHNNLCIQCGVCSAICPKRAIVLKRCGCDYLPQVDDATCVNCGLCQKVCPMNNLCDNYKSESPIEDFILRDYKVIYSAKSLDTDILRNATSGGVVTQLVKTLLTKDMYDCAFMLRGYNYDNQLEMQLYKKNDELQKSQKSRYLTVNYAKVCQYIADNPDKKVIIIATGCAVNAILKFIKLKNLNRDNYLFIGLVCDKTMNYGVVEYFRSKCKNKNLADLYFRTKEKSGWPGDVLLQWNDGTKTHLNKRKRMEVKDYFMPECCLYCLNKLNVNADIVCGDNYIEKHFDTDGKSVVLIRTDMGNNVFNASKEFFEIESVSRQEFLQSLVLNNRERNIAYAKIKGLLSGDVSEEYKQNYKRALKKIRIGHFAKPYWHVRFDIKMSKIIAKIKSKVIRKKKLK